MTENRSKPINMMIIGAQKAGTSAIHQYLGGHPQICTHQTLEFGYFGNDTEFQKGYDQAFSRYFYEKTDEHKIILAKSVNVMYSTEQQKRLLRHNPRIYCIIMLRNPIDRAYSAYWYARRVGAEKTKQFEIAIQEGIERFNKSDIWRRTTCDYLERSIYSKYIQQIQENFPRENISIFTVEDMKQNILGICKGIFKELGVNENFTPNTAKIHNKAAMPRSFILSSLINTRHPLREKFTSLIPPKLKDNVRKITNKGLMTEFTPPPMSPDTRMKLIEYFQPHNSILSTLLNRDLSHWNK